MKKLFILLTLVALIMTNFIPLTNAKESTILQYNNIASLDFNIKTGQGIPQNIDELYLKKNFSYSTMATNNIIYIVHYINSLNLIDDGKAINSSDGSYVSMNFKTTNGLIDKLLFLDGQRVIIKDKQYAVDRNEYNRLLDFIYALKTERLIIGNDEITFNPSEWARSDVDNAVNEGLVPKLNQINYIGKITRLEVCQLIDNLLNKQGIVKNNPVENPFSDTADESVVSLYNYNIINGKNESELYPYDYITREEFAKILANTYHMFNNSFMPDNCSAVYTDWENISDWAINSVNEVSYLKLFVGNDAGEFQPQNNITKEEVIITLLRLYDLIDSKYSF